MITVIQQTTIERLTVAKSTWRAPSARITQPTVLIVDDSPINLSLVIECLTMAGYRVLVARDGESAIARAQRTLPDLVLLDVLMPGINGFETCRRLKEIPALQHIPVIFATGLTDPIDKAHGFEQGGVDYIIKPFQAEEVVARITVHVDLYHARQQLTTQNMQLQREVAERSRVETRLRETQNDLEQRVAQRTAELHQMNLALQAQIREREAAELRRAALYQIAEAAISTSSLTDLSQVIHAALSGLMPAESFAVAIYDQRLGLLSHPYFADRIAAPPATAPLGRSLTAHVFRSGLPLAATSETIRAMAIAGEIDAEDAQLMAWLGAPLRVERRIIGVVSIRSYSPEAEFGPRECQLVEFVSAQIAMAIERHRAEEAIRQQLLDLTHLHAVALAMVEATTEEQLVRRVAGILAERLAGATVSILITADDSADPSMRSLQERWGAPDQEPLESPLITTSIPLRLAKELIGEIMIRAPQGAPLWDDNLQMIETIASQLALAIKKLRLYHQTQHHIRRLNALHTIDKAITSSLNLQLTLEVLLDQAIGQLGVDGAAISLFDQDLQSIDYIAQRGTPASTAPRQRMRSDECFAGQIVLAHLSLTHHDLRRYPTMQVHDTEVGAVAHFGTPIVVKGQVRGVFEVLLQNPSAPRIEWLDFVNALAAQAAIAIDNTALYDALQRSNQQLSVAIDATLEGWSRALELRDQETQGHSQRVTDLAVRLAQRLGVTGRDLMNLRRGALLHDIGKMGIPDSILLKSGPLDADEWQVMRQHPTHAFDLLYPVPYLRDALDIPLRHHERWDGSGYPRGLRGEHIPLAARIFAVVDVWDALTSDRPYRKAWPSATALEYLLSQSGKHFDPQVVEMFVSIAQDPDMI